MTDRPACPNCGHGVYQLRASRGVFGAYPCGHWLTPDQAAALRDEAAASRQ